MKIQESKKIRDLLWRRLLSEKAGLKKELLELAKLYGKSPYVERLKNVANGTMKY